MKNNPTENTVTLINLNVFFQEFTFSKNDFKVNKDQFELADNVIWLDDIFLIFQIKDRSQGEKDDDLKWFKKKVTDKAVSQIKNTLRYLNDYPNIVVENNKGHKLNVAEARHNSIKKIIVYTPGENFPEEKRQLKFQRSSTAGLIHLFHSEDYLWICKYLLSPAEIDEYLQFREELFEVHAGILAILPEQYVLGHFLETLEADHIDLNYISNLKMIDDESPDFDMSGIINDFTKKLTLSNGPLEYYAIIKEIAKLNRSELLEFKKRFVWATEKCKFEKLELPHRVYFPRTDCGFVFIALPLSKTDHWKTAITNYTLAHKYDQKAKKCLGVLVIDMLDGNEQYYNLFWMYAEAEWQYDELIERQLSDNYPFRPVKTKKLDNRYKAGST